ncbi:hypothetical protein PENTCL1PPCAC_22186, partial [Pristionchus entomophagus]
SFHLFTLLASGSPPSSNLHHSCPAMPEFLLQLDTDKVEFASDKLGEEPCPCVVKITNPQKDKFLYKIKCTSNELFRIRPPFGYIKPGKTESIKERWSSTRANPFPSLASTVSTSTTERNKGTRPHDLHGPIRNPMVRRDSTSASAS